ncbi:FAD-dependent oxidoreductase [Candidatus Gottesmanbacteria bacterium]|nr:FAD-dependent oxidoreductase [Candidatus Gottesmanbacteria bacterium]
MDIAIIGGGLTGLTAAYTLAKQGHRITMFEKEKTLGGLACGFKKGNWQWHLESAYHHLFTNDDAILSLINKLGLKDELILTRPITANYYQKKIFQFDNPLHLLCYPALSLTAKLRTATLAAFLKINPFWKPLESITAEKLIRTVGGDEAWKKLWKPLLTAKFGTYARSVAASWFWARIQKRTPKLYYIEGGFRTIVAALEQAIKKNRGKIYVNTAISSISSESGIMNTESREEKNTIHNSKFDKVLLTTPTPIAEKLISGCQLSPNIPHLHAQTLILETEEPILKDTYWLNIMDRSFPFLAVVAHTNMIDKSHYGNRHITYFANYLPTGHPYLSMNKKQLLKIFLPYIKKLNPSFHWSDWLNWSDLFIGHYAQPVHELHYSRRAPKLDTGIPGLYLANLDSIYPWDRGTNYAVELGQRAAAAMS